MSTPTTSRSHSKVLFHRLMTASLLLGPESATMPIASFCSPKAADLLDRLLLWRRRVILQHLGSCLSEILLALVRLGLCVYGFAGNSAPYQVMAVAVIHIER